MRLKKRCLPSTSQYTILLFIVPPAHFLNSFDHYYQLTEHHFQHYQVIRKVSTAFSQWGTGSSQVQGIEASKYGGCRLSTVMKKRDLLPQYPMRITEVSWVSALNSMIKREDYWLLPRPIVPLPSGLWIYHPTLKENQ